MTYTIEQREIVNLKADNLAMKGTSLRKGVILWLKSQWRLNKLDLKNIAQESITDVNYVEDLIAILENMGYVVFVLES